MLLGGLTRATTGACHDSWIKSSGWGNVKRFHALAASWRYSSTIFCQLRAVTGKLPFMTIIQPKAFIFILIMSNNHATADPWNKASILIYHLQGLQIIGCIYPINGHPDSCSMVDLTLSSGRLGWVNVWGKNCLLIQHEIFQVAKYLVLIS